MYLYFSQVVTKRSDQALNGGARRYCSTNNRTKGDDRKTTRSTLRGRDATGRYHGRRWRETCSRWRTYGREKNSLYSLDSRQLWAGAGIPQQEARLTDSLVLPVQRTHKYHTMAPSRPGAGGRWGVLWSTSTSTTAVPSVFSDKKVHPKKKHLRTTQACLLACSTTTIKTIITMTRQAAGPT